MKNHDFINDNIGKDVFITGRGDLGMDRELRRLVSRKSKLKIVKLTRGGMAYLTDGVKCYSVPPRNVREYSEIEIIKEG